MEEQKINQKIKTAYEHAAPEKMTLSPTAIAEDQAGKEAGPSWRMRAYKALSVAAAVLVFLAGFAVSYITIRQTSLLHETDPAVDSIASGDNGTQGSAGETDETAASRENENTYAVSLANYPVTSTSPLVLAQEYDPWEADDGNTAADLYDEWYEEWNEETGERKENQENYPESYNDFAITTMKQLLVSEAAETSSPENMVYSPLSVYLSLAMLAEATDGNSRAQILTLLGTDSLETLRTQTEALWLGNYIDDGEETSILGTSLWLNEAVSFNQSALDTLSAHYYTSVYQGNMASGEYLDAMMEWLNSQTGNLLTEQTENLRSELSAEAQLVLLSTIYYQAKWDDEFNAADTEESTFYSTAGEVTCDFMNQELGWSNYYWGEHYSAIFKKFYDSEDEGGGMWLILPDEGISPEELLGDEDLAQMLTDETAWQYQTYVETDWENVQKASINLSMPKFDIVSDLSLTDAMGALGVTDIFSVGTADFSALSGDGLFLFTIKHAARVAVDEEGVTATAYTASYALGGLWAEEEIDFVLNRPFLFVIVSDTGTILFAGIVNQP